MNAKSLMVGIGISGPKGAGKTALALRLADLFEQLGVKDIKFNGLELYDEELIAAQKRACALPLDLPPETTVYFNEVSTDRDGGTQGGTVGARCKEESELTPEELGTRFNWKEHPTHTQALWKNDIFTCGTLDGYWEWVQVQVGRNK